MENRLSELPDLGYNDEPSDQIKVAITTFAYKNGDVIELLRNRGNLIKNEDWEGMTKIDAQINTLK